MSPQERWQRFRAPLPQFSLWQKILWGGLVLGGLCFGLLVILPFLLPLGGTLASLPDADGAWADLGGEKLYFRHHQGEGESVVLIHGFGWSSADWGYLLPELAPYDVYAPDLMGMGLSDKGLALDLSHPAQAARLSHWLENLDLGAVHLVGHDMGGNIALHLAQSHPEQVKSLSLIAPALQYQPTASLPKVIYEWPFLRRWARVLLRGIMPETTEINFRSAAFQDGFITPELVSYSQRVYQTPDWDLSLLAMARDIRESYLPETLASVEIPTLIIWGAEDRWIAPQDLASEFPHAQQISLAEVGHLPMYEAPQETAASLIRFWSDQSHK